MIKYDKQINTETFITVSQISPNLAIAKETNHGRIKNNLKSFSNRTFSYRCNRICNFRCNEINVLVSSS